MSGISQTELFSGSFREESASKLLVIVRLRLLAIPKGQASVLKHGFSIFKPAVLHWCVCVCVCALKISDFAYFSHLGEKNSAFEEHMQLDETHLKTLFDHFNVN